MRKFLSATFLSSLLMFSLPLHAEEKEDKKEEDPAKISEETLRMLDLFGSVFEKVRGEYVEAPKDRDLIETAINGMLTSLDPHSSFMNKEAFAEMQVQTKGAFGGLGIEVTLKNGLVYVVSPIDDTPAFKAGIEAGDYVSHIDGESVMGLALSDAVKKLRGEPKTGVKLTILRKGKEEPFDVTVVRDVINVKSVRSQSHGDVGYVRITSFTEQTDKDLSKEVKKMRESIGKNFKGIVLDLRNNPGGLLNQAVAVSDDFLDSGEIVSTRGRKSDDMQRFNATKGDLIDNLPMVVLINTGSASASEIVAGALQDHKRAVIMGTKSFGKGSVQTIIPIGNDSAIRLTTSRYYTPSGRSIQAMGIDPDINVEQAKVEYVSANRDSTTEASLRGHLENPDDKEETSGEQKPEEKTKTLVYPEDKKDGDADPLKSDYQLARAVDLIRAINVYQKR